LSFPLAGDFKAQGKSLVEIQKIISERLSQYIADPVITVSAKQLLGNRIYVIGKVNKPGEYIVNRYVDVMQALSMAAGMTPFSAVNDIKILRRNEEGKQQAIEFRYGDVEDGDDLEQNIILKNGDVVVVP
jgi:polysaccharide export outer membrane protein